jgi:hypothetical protein
VVLRAFRIGLLAIVFLVALRVLAGFAFGFVDRFLVVAFFFAGAAADFAFGVVFLVRLLAAPIAAPNHGTDDGYAQCCPGHGASRRPTQSAPSRAYGCISGTLILVFVVHVSPSPI